MRNCEFTWALRFVQALERFQVVSGRLIDATGKKPQFTIDDRQSRPAC